MGSRSHRKKSRYLTRMLIIGLAFSLIPFIILLGITLMRTHKQLISANESAYADASHMFLESIETELSDARKYAAQLALDSRDPTKKAYDLIIRDEPATYYKWEALNTLDEFNGSSRFTIGIYYPDRNSFLYRSAYSIRSFYYDYLAKSRMTADSIPPEELTRFFEEPDGIRYYSFGDKMLMGLPVSLGHDRLNALIVFFFDQTWIDVPQYRLYSLSPASLRIYSTDGTLLLNGNPQIAVTLEPEVIRDGTGTRQILTADNENYTVYICEATFTGLRYAAVVPTSQITRNIETFYRTMRLLFDIEILILIALFFLMTYLNYRPIRDLHQSIPGETSENELEDIRAYINRLNSDLTEQKSALMDSLMKNLVSGTEIPNRLLERAGLDPVPYGCVLRLEGESLSSAAWVRLASRLALENGITLLVTDTGSGVQNTVICLMPQPDPDCVIRLIREELRNAGHLQTELIPGCVVEKIEDIHLSYESCLPVPEPDSGAESVPAGNAGEEAGNSKSRKDLENLREQILEYLGQAYSDPDLSQAAVADKFGMSTYSLSRFFRSHIGAGFSEYVTMRRMESAREMLLTTDRSVNEIAALVGIPNSNYFSRLFKANTGLSPNKFRDAQTAGEAKPEA